MAAVPDRGRFGNELRQKIARLRPLDPVDQLRLFNDAGAIGVIPGRIYRLGLHDELLAFEDLPSPPVRWLRYHVQSEKFANQTHSSPRILQLTDLAP